MDNKILIIEKNQGCFDEAKSCLEKLGYKVYPENFLDLYFDIDKFAFSSNKSDDVNILKTKINEYSEKDTKGFFGILLNINLKGSEWNDESGLELKNDVFKKDYPQVKIVYYEDLSQYQPPPALFINKYNFRSELSEEIEQHFPKL